jgi:hypothetical protein
VQKVYVPDAVKAGAFKGSVTLKLLTYDERMELAEESANGSSTAATLRKMAKTHKGKWVTVDLTRLADGAVFKSYDDLQYGPDCHAIINEVYGWLIAGDKDQGKTLPL